MLNTLSPVAEDLAGQSYTSPHYLQTQHRISSLIDKYIAVEQLHDRLQDLPIQFANLNRVLGNLSTGKQLTAIKLSA